MTMKVLVRPSFKKGQGSGHLRRSVRFVRELGDEGYLLLEDCLKYSGRSVRELITSLGITQPKLKIREKFNSCEHWDLIVLDNKATDLKEFKRFAASALVVGIDEGGRARDFFPYLIDTLPGTETKNRANINSISLLDLPKRVKESLQFPFQNILISFGGEDPENLSLRLLKVLLSDSIFRREQITVVQGSLFTRKSWPREIRILKDVWDLKNLLMEFDLVFTSYGLTCFESLAAGVPVILLNPSPYHKRLCLKMSIPEIGVINPNRRKLKRLLKERLRFEDLLKRMRIIRHKRDASVKSLLASISVNDTACPVCRAQFNPVVARFRMRSYFRCRICGIIYLQSFAKEAVGYGEDYFSIEYKRQYGKTYIEDFNNIEKISLRRLKEIERSFPGRECKSVLDVGCAFGPFLKAALDQGYEPVGLDISTQAVEYVREVLKLPCYQGSFEELCADSSVDLFSPKSFDLITMWFVIEHFSRLDHVLSEVNTMLKPGGIFAFSTPNGTGVSAKQNLSSFLEKSPADHYTVWSPGLAVSILQRFGFQIRRIVITGHHPERFPCVNIMRRLMPAASKIFKLGDTFEVYAEKCEEL